MTAAGAVVGCHVCGTETLVQVFVSNIHHDDDGELRVDVEVDPRDQEVLETFWASHQDPWAKALRGS